MADGAARSGSDCMRRHATMTPAMKVQGACPQCFLCLLMVGMGVVRPLAAQALYSEPLGNGSELLVIAEPLADVTTVVWPAIDDGDVSSRAITSGDLTLIADLEAALSEETTDAAPAVFIVVGGAPVPELRGLLDRVLANRSPSQRPDPAPKTEVQGRFERRLGRPGSDAEIRLEVHLPPPADPSRSTVEVLWSLLPELLNDGLEGVRTRTDGDLGLLEARTESEMADIAHRRLELELARIAENPSLRPERVAAATQRLLVQRRALLERHPDAAHFLLELWIEGGVDAVREFLFAVEGVTLEKVRVAAQQWLPQHPGNIVIVLPPRSYRPRFAEPPQIVQLDSGLTAAVLERSGASLATLCMRPVVVPDLDYELAATVLSRLARELRDDQERPGWIWVNADPPQLELALSAGEFVRLGEVLQAALGRVADDRQPVMAEGGSARRRALRLMAEFLGVAEGMQLSPASLLRPGNLALGLVAEDGETAADALHKFWAQEDLPQVVATSRPVAPVPRTREAAAGGESALVVDLELGAAGDEVVATVLAEVLNRRAAEIFEVSIDVLQPFVPGHRVVLLVASASLPFDELESQLVRGWPALTAPIVEEELVGVRREVAALSSAAWSGATGRARRCAAVAAGAVQWRPTSDLEMSILAVPAESVNSALAGVADWKSLHNTGAGALPIVELDQD